VISRLTGLQLRKSHGDPRDRVYLLPVQPVRRISCFVEFGIRPPLDPDGRDAEVLERHAFRPGRHRASIDLQAKHLCGRAGSLQRLFRCLTDVKHFELRTAPQLVEPKCVLDPVNFFLLQRVNVGQ